MKHKHEHEHEHELGIVMYFKERYIDIMTLTFASWGI